MESEHEAVKGLKLSVSAADLYLLIDKCCNIARLAVRNSQSFVKIALLAYATLFIQSV